MLRIGPRSYKWWASGADGERGDACVAGFASCASRGFEFLSGRTSAMVKTSCAADAAAFSAPAILSFLAATLVGAALLCGPATADPDPAAAGPAGTGEAAPARGELEEI